MCWSRVTTIVTFLVATVFVSAALARDATLKLKDGRRISGQLVAETGDTVTLKVAGIETGFPRDEIESIEIEMTLSERFAKERAGIADDDYNARYELARRVFDTRSREGYEIALTELDSVLKAKPDHAMAQLLRSVVTERLNLDKDPAEPKDPIPPPPPGDGPIEPQPDPGAAGAVEAPRKLTPEEINLIKVFEVRIDSKPNVLVPRKVLEEVLAKYQDHRDMAEFLGVAGNRKWFGLKGWEQLDKLFDLQAREHYDQVMVRDLPDTLKTFQQSIHRQYVVGYCGRCHGEGRAKGLYIVTRSPTSENTLYTNLMLIRRTHANGLPLVFTAQENRSPLLQYGLPRKLAPTPHPDVQGLQPYFTTTDHPQYVLILKWMEQLYGENEDYPIEFKAPWVGGAAPAPDAPEKPPAAGGPAAAPARPAPAGT